MGALLAVAAFRTLAKLEIFGALANPLVRAGFKVATRRLVGPDSFEVLPKAALTESAIGELAKADAPWLGPSLIK